jgi:hypothetical protein
MTCRPQVAHVSTAVSHVILMSPVDHVTSPCHPQTVIGQYVSTLTMLPPSKSGPGWRCPLWGPLLPLSVSRHPDPPYRVPRASSTQSRVPSHAGWRLSSLSRRRLTTYPRTRINDSLLLMQHIGDLCVVEHSTAHCGHELMFAGHVVDKLHMCRRPGHMSSSCHPSTMLRAPVTLKL